MDASDAIEITLPRQLKTITDLGFACDWNAVRLRLGNELRPLEAQTAVLVNGMNRIGYEAIRNAYTHSRGTRIQVDLSYTNDLVLCVTDDGVGMDSAVAEYGKEGHFGLPGMRDRALRIGGSLIVRSSASLGTQVKFSIPSRNIFGGARSNWLAKVFSTR